MKMDELTKQVTLLGKHQIGTDEQLFSYKRSVEDEIKSIKTTQDIYGHLFDEVQKTIANDLDSLRRR